MASWQQSYQIYRKYVRSLSLLYQKRQDVRAFTELLLSVSVISIFGIFAIKPTLVTLAQLNTDIAGKRDTIDKLDAKIQALTQAQSNFDTNQSLIKYVDTAIPSNPSPIVYARQIEGLAQKDGVYLVSSNTKGVSIKGGSPSDTQSSTDTGNAQDQLIDSFPTTSQSYKVSVNLSGDYNQTVNFVRDLESLRWPIYEDDFQTRISQGDLPGEIILTVDGRVPYYLGNSQPESSNNN